MQPSLPAVLAQRPQKNICDLEYKYTHKNESFTQYKKTIDHNNFWEY